MYFSSCQANMSWIQLSLHRYQVMNHVCSCYVSYSNMERKNMPCILRWLSNLNAHQEAAFQLPCLVSEWYFSSMLSSTHAFVRGATGTWSISHVLQLTELVGMNKWFPLHTTQSSRSFVKTIWTPTSTFLKAAGWFVQAISIQTGEFVFSLFHTIVPLYYPSQLSLFMVKSHIKSPASNEICSSPRAAAPQSSLRSSETLRASWFPEERSTWPWFPANWCNFFWEIDKTWT